MTFRPRRMWDSARHSASAGSRRRPSVGVESFSAGPRDVGSRVYRFGAEGEPLAAFGPGGAREFGSAQPGLVQPSGALILDERMGRTLKLVEVDRRGGRGEGAPAGHRRPPPEPRGARREGADPARGFVGSPISAPEQGQPRSSFVVARLFPDGKIDRSFGGNGWIFSRLPGRRELIATRADPVRSRPGAPAAPTVSFDRVMANMSKVRPAWKAFIKELE